MLDHSGAAPIAQIKELRVEFQTKDGPVVGVKDVSFTINSGEPPEVLIRYNALRSVEITRISSSERYPAQLHSKPFCTISYSFTAGPPVTGTETNSDAGRTASLTRTRSDCPHYSNAT